MAKKQQQAQQQYFNPFDITLNPANPRTITDRGFGDLVRSVITFPEMMAIRGIAVDAHLMAIGGNMRTLSIRHILTMPELELEGILAGIDDNDRRLYLVGFWNNIRQKQAIPTSWLADASGLTDAQIREFIIKDNLPFGQWDAEGLANEWNTEELTEWGLDMPKTFGVQPEGEDEEEAELKAWVPDCLFPSNNPMEVPTLDPEWQADFITTPVTLWGKDKRTKKLDGGTILFYVDDYRFTALWDDPGAILRTGCAAIAEPNLSLYDTMPISYGLHLIYKKRWLSRWLQLSGIKIFVDLNVSVKFAQYNLLGVPDGWNAFCTRGYTDRITDLKEEIKIAQQVSGKDQPNLVVYGGGGKVQEVVAKHNLTYIETFRNFDS